MITQRINLYKDRFKPKQTWVCANQAVIASIFVIISVFVWSTYLERQSSQWQQKMQSLNLQKQTLANELNVVNGELALLIKDQKLEREVASMARKISDSNKVLKFVDANQFGSGSGFSEYLLALSKLHTRDVWLNKIKLGENYLQIKGSALRAEQVPEYFNRFSGEEIFQGSRFELFELKRAEETDWKVDFEIATYGEKNE